MSTPLPQNAGFEPRLEGESDLDYLNRTTARRIADRLNAHFRELAGREPRWRYFEARGWWFGWTTERATEGHRGFQSFAYKPTGKGARSGQADRMELTMVRIHSTRKAAKARALRLRNQRLAKP